MDQSLLESLHEILTKLPGRVASLSQEGGRILAVLESRPGVIAEETRIAAQAAMAALPGVTAATLVLTGEKEQNSDAPQHRLPPQALPGVARVLAVGSGKGGVGKSTVAVNLAVALAGMGRRVGLLDADIYGPSQPRMTGLEKAGKPSLTADGARIMPFVQNGIKVMSLGFLVDPGQAVVWRGPMIQKAVAQMTRGTDWGDLDILIVDLPPGTGDASLALCQMVRVDGAVIVSTPQDVALLDAVKAADMFDRLGVPLAGLVENMSFYHCPSCGHEDHVFGHGGAAGFARRRGIPFLGEIPLQAQVMQAGDQGQPIVLSDPAHPAARALAAAAKALLAGLEKSAVA